MHDENLTRWRARLERAAALLSERLDNPPSLKELAGAAAVSPYHFHRIWRALTNETVSQTVLRLRLEASQALLQARDASVAETAMAVGFGTPQSFARAFRRHTGLTPTEHRARSRSDCRAEPAGHEGRDRAAGQGPGRGVTAHRKALYEFERNLRTNLVLGGSHPHHHSARGHLRNPVGRSNERPGRRASLRCLSGPWCCDCTHALQCCSLASRRLCARTAFRVLRRTRRRHTASRQRLATAYRPSTREFPDRSSIHQRSGQTPVDELATDILLPLAPQGGSSP